MSIGNRSRAIRRFLLLEAASLVVASLAHSGLLVEGYVHAHARVAESVIAAVLLAAVVASAALPGATRRLALVAQAFALLGTLVGVFTIILGIGPRTAPDVVYHLALVTLLLAGLRFARRARG